MFKLTHKPQFWWLALNCCKTLKDIGLWGEGGQGPSNLLDNPEKLSNSWLDPKNKCLWLPPPGCLVFFISPQSLIEVVLLMLFNNKTCHYHLGLFWFCGNIFIVISTWQSNLNYRCHICFLNFTLMMGNNQMSCCESVKSVFISNLTFSPILGRMLKAPPLKSSGLRISVFRDRSERGAFNMFKKYIWKTLK